MKYAKKFYNKEYTVTWFDTLLEGAIIYTDQNNNWLVSIFLLDNTSFGLYNYNGSVIGFDFGKLMDKTIKKSRELIKIQSVIEKFLQSKQYVILNDTQANFI